MKVYMLRVDGKVLSVCVIKCLFWNCRGFSKFYNLDTAEIKEFMIADVICLYETFVTNDTIINMPLVFIDFYCFCSVAVKDKSKGRASEDIVH